MNAPKPGYKTTEFWLGLAAVVIGAFVASGVRPDTHWSVQIAGVILAALGTLGYTAARKAIKTGNGNDPSS